MPGFGTRAGRVRYAPSLQAEHAGTRRLKVARRSASPGRIAVLAYGSLSSRISAPPRPKPAAYISRGLIGQPVRRGDPALIEPSRPAIRGSGRWRRRSDR